MTPGTCPDHGGQAVAVAGRYAGEVH